MVEKERSKPCDTSLACYVKTEDRLGSDKYPDGIERYSRRSSKENPSSHAAQTAILLLLTGYFRTACEGAGSSHQEIASSTMLQNSTTQRNSRPLVLRLKAVSF